MFSQINKAMYSYAQKMAKQPALWASFVRKTAKNYVVTAHHPLLILSLFAIGLFSLIFVKPEIANQFKALSLFAAEQKIGVPLAPVPPVQDVKNTTAEVRTAQQETPHTTKLQYAGNATSMQQKWVTYWLSKRYRIAGDAIHKLVLTSYKVAHDLKLDPLLILSVIAIESRFNPLSESPVGAQGLMQVMSKIHQDKFQKHGGVEAALNPVANINVGSRILKEYVVEGGSIEAGLKKYVGAAAFATDFGYGNKVLSEYSYLQEVATGKKVSSYVTVRARPHAQSKIVKSTEPAELSPTAIDDSPKHKSDQKNPTDQIATL
ncbi:MAG: lytic transglycosylase domain-containing protein [Glaciimonas sp.]|nr:lytic transglycosylase domain-containing protein [Glaciimonas sp.]